MFKPEADRLASRALAWLEEADKEESAPSWGYFLRLGANTGEVEGARPEKMPAFVLERGSILPLVLLVPKAFRTDERQEEKRRRQKG